MSFIPPGYRDLWRAAVVLGIGLGGFVDGILLHQVLQWHHLASSMSGDVPLNVMLDGLFHAAAWVATAIGLWLLHRAWKHHPETRDGHVLAGGILAGGGGFNLVEGILNHHILGIHHVWPEGPGPTWAWDVGFLVFGVALVWAGAGQARRARPVPA